MTLARTHAIALVGVEGHMVEVEAYLAAGLPGTSIVGLPDTALTESRDRVRAAVSNSGQGWPQQRITISLSPASLPKRGSSFDLAIAASVLAAAEVVPPGALDSTVLVGELGLNGRVRPVRGVLPAVLKASAAGMRRVVVPRANAGEARLVPDVEVLGVSSLEELMAHLRGQQPAGDEPDEEIPERVARNDSLDLRDVLGQAAARKALEIGAAGGHHMFMLGPPGAGKTMLAQRLPTILPPLEKRQALEVTAIHSVAGSLRPGDPLIQTPPFCDPHHTATKAAIVGGGSGQIRPGAASRAHLGVLFLDEAPEFNPGVLDALRQPLESGEVAIFRSAAVARFPAEFTLVLAANQCPCARAQSGGCVCTPNQRRRYLGRLSGPLLDRVDLNLELLALSPAEMRNDVHCAESSVVVAERVANARARASWRLAGTPWATNAEIPGAQMRSRFAPAAGALETLEDDMQRGLLSARGVDRILRVSWTLADLTGRDRPGQDDVALAAALRRGVAW